LHVTITVNIFGKDQAATGLDAYVTCRTYMLETRCLYYVWEPA